MFSEKDMEDAIWDDAEKYLGEKGLTRISRQYRIGKYIFDLLFQNRHGAKLIVEIQKGTLDMSHTHKILDYYLEYKENYPDAFIELMVIANRIPYERRRRLDHDGIEWKEIPESEFLGRHSSTEPTAPTPGLPPAPLGYGDATQNAYQPRGDAKSLKERESNIKNGLYGGPMRLGLHRGGCESGNIDETILRLINEGKAVNPQSISQNTGYPISRIKSHLRHLEIAHGITFSSESRAEQFRQWLRDRKAKGLPIPSASEIAEMDSRFPVWWVRLELPKARKAGIIENDEGYANKH